MVARAGPQAPGSKEIPTGNEECLTVQPQLYHLLTAGPYIRLHGSTRINRT